jgi:carboxynorspermidine decarboxylase
MLTTEKPQTNKVDSSDKLLTTPYYLIDETRLLENMKKIAFVRERSGAKVVLALKCFSTWSVFDVMKPYFDGTTSSSLFEARLGYEKFGKEVHAYSVAFSDSEMESVRLFASKIIFNSASQLKRFLPLVNRTPLGLRINPGISHSDFDLADPARKHSRLGVADKDEAMSLLPHITGVMFHCNCENSRFEKFSDMLDTIADRFGPLLHTLEWVSLGGGIYFTKDGYPLEEFAKKLADFSKKFNVQVYLEPGESAVTQSGFFVTRVLDIIHNEVDVAIIDAAVETHMLDLMIYNTPAKLQGATEKGIPYTIAGRTCLAGDVFGTYHLPQPLKVGDLVTFTDTAGYTNVKKNWFNGVAMPSIVIRRTDGRMTIVKQFEYADYVSYLS